MPTNGEGSKVAVDHSIRQLTLSQSARDDIREQARRKAMLTMTEAEWEAHRAAAGDPVREDVRMAFETPDPENSE